MLSPVKEYCHRKKKEKHNHLPSLNLVKNERKMIVLPTKKELAVAIATQTAVFSAKFCKERGYFTVVLSGGDLISWLG